VMRQSRRPPEIAALDEKQQPCFAWKGVLCIARSFSPEQQLAPSIPHHRNLFWTAKRRWEKQVVPGELQQLRVDVGLEADADAEELDEETVRLRNELLELDVEAVERRSEGPPPPGTRAIEVAVLGSLLVALGREAIPAVVRTIESWVGRRRDRSVKLELGGDSIELSSVSTEEQQRLLRAFLARHGETG
jgi:hypothetical protein